MSWLHLPPENPRDPHHKKFGVLVLADGSCGFFYTRLGDNLKQLRNKIDEKQILGTPVLDLAEGYDNANLVKRSLGLGALNASLSMSSAVQPVYCRAMSIHWVNWI